ncbi:MAG: peptidase C39 bacteriocin processing, partial [Chloroflexia bacterium]|nr:peptidase C39 bacteriocin processing [Chloroflexia bacterium]
MPFTKFLMLFFLTKICGLGLSILLILHEFKVQNDFIDKICHINKRTDCNTVLNTVKSKIYGWFTWADAG